jgi:hypothetical protein
VLPTVSTTITAGSILIPVNAQTYLGYSADNTATAVAPKALGLGLVYAAEDVATMTTPAATTKRVLIRAM